MIYISLQAWWVELDVTDELKITRILRLWYLLAHVEKLQDQIESHYMCLADALRCTDGAMVG